jgi:hypothetical protein
MVNRAFCELEPQVSPSPKTEINLKDINCKIVYETFRKTNGRENWELYLINADGSNPVNITNTPNSDEMYPHASPDGKKVCFVADEMVGGRKMRNVYYMNIDGTGRVKVADNARQPCWGPDSKTIAYLPGELTVKPLRTYRANSNATPSKIMLQRGLSFMTFRPANIEDIQTRICFIFIIFPGPLTGSGFLQPYTEVWISNMPYWHSRPMERIFMI